MHYFIALFRLHQYQKAQALGFAFVKQFGNSSMAYFGITALILQAQKCSDERMKTVMLYPLVERHLTKMVADGKVTHPGESLLHARYYQLRQQHEQLLEFLKTPQVCYSSWVHE
jgi:hypothetical protein